MGAAVTAMVLDGQRLVTERVDIEDLLEWRREHDLMPVCALAWPSGETWPPIVFYAPVYRPGQPVPGDEQGEGRVSGGENQGRNGAPETVPGDLKVSAVQDSLPLFISM